jgi:hypothetical protein
LHDLGHVHPQRREMPVRRIGRERLDLPLRLMNLRLLIYMRRQMAALWPIDSLMHL